MHLLRDVIQLKHKFAAWVGAPSRSMSCSCARLSKSSPSFPSVVFMRFPLESFQCTLILPMRQHNLHPLAPRGHTQFPARAASGARARPLHAHSTHHKAAERQTARTCARMQRPSRPARRPRWRPHAGGGQAATVGVRPARAGVAARARGEPRGRPPRRRGEEVRGARCEVHCVFSSGRTKRREFVSGCREHGKQVGVEEHDDQGGGGTDEGGSRVRRRARERPCSSQSARACAPARDPVPPRAPDAVFNRAN